MQNALGAQKSVTQITFENRFTVKNGKIIVLEWTAHWSASDNHLFCIAHDITKRKRAENRLSEREIQLRTTLESMPVGIVTIGAGGQIEYANSSMEKLSGVSQAELIGTNLAGLFTESQQPPLQQIIEAFDRAETEAKQVELELTTSEKISTYVECSATAFLIEASPKYLVTFSDISQRKENERLRREFVAMVNHDLKAPLTSFNGLVQRVESGAYGELDAQGKEVCKIAAVELERLMRLVADLLDLDKMNSGKLILNQEKIAVLDIIEASVSSIKTYAEIRDVEIVYDESESPCWADRSRSIQVLVNLLSNAVKFAPARSRVEIKVVEENSDEIRLCVFDNGPGIPADKAALMFRRHQQIDPDTLVQRASSGLGLSICKAIVEAQNGRIGYTSLPGGGSEFWFTMLQKPQL